MNESDRKQWMLALECDIHSALVSEDCRHFVTMPSQSFIAVVYHNIERPRDYDARLLVLTYYSSILVRKGYTAILQDMIGTHAQTPFIAVFERDLD